MKFFTAVLISGRKAFSIQVLIPESLTYLLYASGTAASAPSDEGRKTSPEEIKQGGFIVIVKDKQYGSAGHLIACKDEGCNHECNASISYICFHIGSPI